MARSCRRLVRVLALSLVAAACEGPVAPSELPGAVTPPTHYVIKGLVTATNGGQAISAATVEFGSARATTDRGGRFVLTTASTPAADTPFVVRGPGVIPRRLFTSPAEQVSLDVISDGEGFDLRFYRELVRNGFETTGGLFPLTRWTTNPRIVLRLIDEQGTPVDATVLNAAATLMASAVKTWTDGVLTASVVKGEPSRSAGEIVVRWLDGSDPSVCGKATVGGTELFVNYVSPMCLCSGFPVSPAGVRHELGHVLGFWHTDSPDDVMYGQANAQACARDISDRERLHAAIAYHRRVGNTDLDDDPNLDVRPAVRMMIN
jgi:hypothetical protein